MLTARSARALLSQLWSARRERRALADSIAGGAASQLTLVVTGIVVARALGPEGRGHFALLTLVAAIFWQFGGLGVPFAITYFVARAPGHARTIIRSLLRPTLVRCGISTAIAALIILLLTAKLPASVQASAVMTVISVPVMVLHLCGLGLLQGLRAFRALNILRVAPNAAFALVALALFALEARGVLVYSVAWGATRALIMPITLVVGWRRAPIDHLRGNVLPPPTSEILGFGARAVLGAASAIENFRVDQSVVALFLSPIALGMYVVALGFTNLPRFVAYAVGLVATPVIARRDGGQEAMRLVWKFFWIAVPLYLPVIVGLWLAAPTLVDVFFGEEFAPAASLTRLLLISTTFLCARRVLTDGARGAGHAGLGSVSEAVALASLVPLFALAVPAWGVDGVAYALAAASLLGICVLSVGLIRVSLSAVTRDARDQ